MIDKVRLKEVKEEALSGTHSLFGNPYVSMSKTNFDWVISAIEELQEELEKYDLNLDHGAKVAIRVAEQLHHTRKENERLREVISSASSELHHALYSHKSKDVKKFYVENAKRYLDRTLEEEQEE